MKTLKEVSQILGYQHEDSLRGAIKRGVVKGTKFGRNWGMTNYQIKQAMKWRDKHGRRKEQTQG